MEAFVETDDALKIRSEIVTCMIEQFQLVAPRLSGGHLEFDTGRAMMEAMSDRLMFWVGASDFSACCGIRALLEMSTRMVAPTLNLDTWYFAEGKPFETVRRALPGPPAG
ncbi:hypothetical protein ACMDCR_00680 [Labrys okinawensis]|uniref:hypothetical protein n=1 Tax=Labrys okinawensis TaxID=346911 RepID=UPI0039BCA25C